MESTPPESEIATDLGAEAPNLSRRKRSTV